MEIKQLKPSSKPKTLIQVVKLQKLKTTNFYSWVLLCVKYTVQCLNSSPLQGNAEEFNGGTEIHQKLKELQGKITDFWYRNS